MQTIGERLEEARKRKGISIREAAEATKIRGEYLHKFESSQFDIKLPDIYVRGFLRTYANYLKLPGEKLVNDYLALGLSEPRQARGLNREFYGRMDLGTHSAPAAEKGADEKSAPPSPKEKPAEPAPSRGGNPATFTPRPNTLPGANFDRRFLIRAGLALAGAVVIVALIIILVQSIANHGASPPSNTASSPSVQSVPSQSITLVALENVRVKLVREFDGTELFQGSLVKGESRSFPKTGSLFLTADSLQSVAIEMNGQRYSTNQSGYGRVKIN